MDIIPEIPWTVILPELSLIASKIFLCPSYWNPVSDIPSQWLPPIDQGHYWYQCHGVAFFWLLFRGIQHQQPCYHYYREYEEKTNKQNTGLNFKNSILYETQNKKTYSITFGKAQNWTKTRQFSLWYNVSVTLSKYCHPTYLNCSVGAILRQFRKPWNSPHRVARADTNHCHHHYHHRHHHHYHCHHHHHHHHNHYPDAIESSPREIPQSWSTPKGATTPDRPQAFLEIIIIITIIIWIAIINQCQFIIVIIPISQIYVSHGSRWWGLGVIRGSEGR